MSAFDSVSAALARRSSSINAAFSAVAAIWPNVRTENLAELTDIVGYRSDFLRLFGFGLPGDRIHAPNERVSMPLLLRGAESAAYLWEELASADLT